MLTRASPTTPHVDHRRDVAGSSRWLHGSNIDAEHRPPFVRREANHAGHVRDGGLKRLGCTFRTGDAERGHGKAGSRS